MNLRQRFRNWRRLRRWRRAARKMDAPLREFVYMDEVSLYSLMASRVGPIATELTDTEASSLQSEASVSGGGNIGAAKLESTTALQIAESTTRQVLRKSIVQSTFKDFYELASDIIALRSQDLVDSDVASRDKLEQLAADGGDEFLVEATKLQRGALIEIEVALEAEAIFHAGEAITGVLEVIQDDPRTFGVTDLAQLAELRSVSRILERLRAGLVPIRGRAPDLVSVELDGREWVAHRELIAAAADAPAATQPVHVVGVAEHGLFWKDLRRVLFSGSAYRVLGRLGRSGLHPNWTPVKLVDVLSKILPDFEAIIDKVNTDLLPTMADAVAAQQAMSKTHQASIALERFAAELIEHSKTSITVDQLRDSGLLEPPAGESEISVASLRIMTQPIVDTIAASEAPDPTQLSYMRSVALLAAQSAAPDALRVPTESQARQARVLDTEIIAIYW